MQKKKGISLIVLVITIIVMVILAATIILAINNNNVVDKAKDAVTDTNYKQVQELAQTTWADAYIDGLRGEDLKNNVLGQLTDYTADYDFEVTDSGVVVTEKDEGNVPEVETVFDYFTYEYDTTNMTAKVIGAKDGYAEVGYYTNAYGVQEQRIYSLIDESGSVVTDVVIPAETTGEDGQTYTVTEIGKLFSYRDVVSDAANCKITSVVLPNTITSLEEYTFYYCISLESIVLPNTITSLRSLSIC